MPLWAYLQPRSIFVQRRPIEIICATAGLRLGRRNGDSCRNPVIYEVLHFVTKMTPQARPLRYFKGGNQNTLSISTG